MQPIDVVLFCPMCCVQHIDRPEASSGWTNPPHKSHFCSTCGCVWRPADVATNGVAVAASRGKSDNWPKLLADDSGKSS